MQTSERKGKRKMEVSAINAALKSHPNKKQIQALLKQKEYQDKKAVPSGLMEDVFTRSNETIYDIELKDILEKAVKSAHLNVTERLALNEKYFPNGGGFELFPDDVYEHQSTLYYKATTPVEADKFLNKALNLNVPDNVCLHQIIIKEGKKPCLDSNLETAMLKLKNVLKK